MYVPALPGDRDGVDAAQIVGALIPIGQVPEERAARDQFQILRFGCDRNCINIGEVRSKIGRGDQYQFPHQRIGRRRQRLIGLETRQIRPRDQPSLR